MHRMTLEYMGRSIDIDYDIEWDGESEKSWEDIVIDEIWYENVGISWILDIPALDDVSKAVYDALEDEADDYA